MKARLISAFSAAMLLAGCATNPVTGKRELALVSEAQEIQMGQQYAQEVESSLGLVEDAELQAYVRRIGARLAAQSERPQIPWRFGVIDDPVPNAFALPGGPVYITRGLMDLMNSEAELAGVLGHEIGHITARHSVQQMSKSQLAQLGLGVASIVRPELQGVLGAASTGMQLLFLKYGRDAERQADELGFGYMLRHNYDVREFDDVFASLQRVGEVEGKSGIPSWMSTHPDPGERVKTAQQRVAALPAPPAPRIINESEYLAQIDGLVYGENPRQGFFRGNLFLHPDLRFRMTFPQGWKTQNMTQAVVAMAPNEDGIFQFTIAKGTPSQAAQAFFSQEGLQAGQRSTQDINGHDAFTGYFQANTQGGVIQGIVAFVAFNGSTYQMLGYAPSARFGNYDPAFRNTIGSFATLTDQSALNVKPNRIDVVRTTSAMTLSQFNARYPSVIPMRDLAIINQVTENAMIPSGTQMKRVITE